MFSDLQPQSVNFEAASNLIGTRIGLSGDCGESSQLILQIRDSNFAMLIPNPWAITSNIGRQTFFFPRSMSEM